MDEQQRKKMWGMVETFDRLSPYTDRMIDRGIEENRKGLFSLRVTDKDGNAKKGLHVTVRQKSHEFNFGCGTFLLDQFGDHRNGIYRDIFKEIFNYGVLPLYWNTLEPERGKPRFASDSAPIYRRPPLDTVRDYCRENGIRMKGHCLMYNSFNPDWMPRDRREIRMAIRERSRAIAERYADDFVDLDVINEMFTVYKNAYGEYGARNLPITDDKDHAAWCFSVAKADFPESRLFWNEGCFETFGRGGGQYCGDKSVYYLMLKRHLYEGVPIEGIGMQYHAFSTENPEIYNPLRAMDIFETYGEFNLPIHISEVSIPSYSNEEEDEQIQAELVRRMYRLWFSRRPITSIVWWNLADGMAFGGENHFHGGLLRNDMSKKPAFLELERLIGREWHTECACTTNDAGEIVFDGYYGDYEITVTDGEKTVTEIHPFKKDNTGYYHLTFGLMQEKMTF